MEVVRADIFEIFPNFRGKAFRVSLLSIMLTLVFFVDAHDQPEKDPFNSLFAE